MILKIFLFFPLFTLFLSGEGTITLDQDEQKYIEAKKEIKVCINPKGLPLYGYEKGKSAGILAEIIYLLEKKLPIPFVQVPAKTWEACIRLSEEKKVDIAGMIIASPNRHRHLIASDIVFDGYLGIASRIEEPFADELSQMKGKKVALLKGQKSINALAKQKLPYFKYVMVDSIEEGLELVARGEVYGYVDDTYSLAYQILKRHSNELKIMEKINTKPIGVSVGIRREELPLLSMMNKAIESVDEQQIRDIVHDWIVVRVERGFDDALFWKVLFLFALILLVSLYWVRRLAGEVARRKEAEGALRDLNRDLERKISTAIEEIQYKDAMLLEKTKLAAIGEMIGSIAHQWRRPLSTLHINIEMLETDYAEGKIDREFVDRFIEKNSGIIQYMSKTIDDFQNFYKIDKEKIVFDVMEKIESVSDLQLNQLAQNDIEIQKEGESFKILGYASEFQQVILNLISNAKDALVEKEIQNPHIRITLSSDGERGYIKISDNAGGIDERYLHKIFEPYFTTKEKSGGTGLGLYISKMIIEKNMQGKLGITNRKEGCEVLITLRLYHKKGSGDV